MKFRSPLKVAVAFALLQSLSAVSAGAPLLNMSSPARIAGEYYVEFKSVAELTELASAELTSTSPPELSPAERVPPPPQAEPPPVSEVPGPTSPDVVTRWEVPGPTSPDAAVVTRWNVEDVGRALAQRANVEFARLSPGEVRNGFSVRGASIAQLMELANDPRVAFIEPVMRLKIDTTQSSAPAHLDRIDQQNLPLNSTYIYDNSAPNVVAIVIDSGIRATHQEFGNRVYNLVDCMHTYGGCYGITAYSVGANHLDCLGHGTSVASLIGGATYGVAKGITLTGAIVTNSSNLGFQCGDSVGNDLDAVQGVRYFTAIAKNNPQTRYVMNLSIDAGSSGALDNAVRDAIAAGIVVVAAAGNDNGDACGVSPGRVPEVITVAGSAPNDQRWWQNTFNGSNFGSCVDLFAPAQDLITAGIASDSAIAQPASGTSGAAAIVTGVVALYLQTHSTDSPAQVQAALIAGATSGVLSTAGPGGLGTGSPNRLVYSRLAAGNHSAAPWGGSQATVYQSTLTKIFSAIKELLLN
jgi:subtilisin family serine protease